MTAAASCTCPYCGRAFDIAHRVLGENDRPVDGDVGVCDRCRQPAIFAVDGERLVMRAMTAGEFAEFKNWYGGAPPR